MSSSVGRVLRELALLGVLWIAYSLARLLASDDVTVAMQHAQEVLRVERWTGLDVESSWNALLHGHEYLSVAAGYWYATMHYVVTAVVLVVLWRRSHDYYVRLRRVLVGATLVALVCYIWLPTAPPRMIPGYVDVLATTSHWGWWGASASAPRGLDNLTNELAAMPSMHVGWALWCTLAVVSSTRSRWLRVLAVGYVTATTLVVVATANHWLLDAIVGAAITGAVWVLTVQATSRWGRLRLPQSPVLPVGAVVAVPAQRTAAETVLVSADAES